MHVTSTAKAMYPRKMMTIHRTKQKKRKIEMEKTATQWHHSRHGFTNNQSNQQNTGHEQIHRNNSLQEKSKNGIRNNSGHTRNYSNLDTLEINSGNYCKICFAPNSDRLFSNCPHLRNNEDLIRSRKKNYEAYRDIGLLLSQNRDIRINSAIRMDINSKDGFYRNRMDGTRLTLRVIMIASYWIHQHSKIRPACAR